MSSAHQNLIDEQLSHKEKLGHPVLGASCVQCPLAQPNRSQHLQVSTAWPWPGCFLPGHFPPKSVNVFIK